ncbi:hypothetical protein [Sansalvadorimonas verongulae]|uniref:hypothetical protein n=1 Tax=Sansalvadorimonas verongulae TaxID=2172824 RepID=UPI0012BCB653|nr:hypothetical protein [Sansalvadorimonas verongulae]MTI15133.1 hypothetical protein [Sansalvadorimonas verongulae]
MPNSHNSRAANPAALLILPLSNGHFMVTRVSRADNRTLPTLNKWYPRFFEALALMQKGSVEYISGRGVMALHRDMGEYWQEHQPRFFRSVSTLIRYAEENKISRLFWHSLTTENADDGQPDSQPAESTRNVTISKGWKELWLTR